MPDENIAKRSSPDSTQLLSQLNGGLLSSNSSRSLYSRMAMSFPSQGDPPPASFSSPSSSPSPSTSTPTSRSASHTPQPPPSSQSPASYFSYPVTHVVSGLYRRLIDTNSKPSRKMRNSSSKASSTVSSVASSSPVFTPVRTASPFQPPPLTPLGLSGESESLQQQLLTRALAEEIRLLVPARLQLVDTWRLAYSLDRDGASLSTLYDNCREFSHRSPRAGYVLVVRDSSPAGAIFGAYMTDPPHPASHYFATGECFLWRASLLQPLRPMAINQGLPSQDMLELAGLPPPPSADTTHAGRSTTFCGERKKSQNGGVDSENTPKEGNGDLLSPPNASQSNGSSGPTDPGTPTPSGVSTPERIRFKAFPYSGVNDYMMFCETGFLSLGGGDGHFGLWMDSSIEKGVSESCQTFGNEPLSDEGVKFDILGVEVWYVGS